MKLLALLLTLLLALSTTACQKETPPDTSMEFKPETDDQYYHASVGPHHVAESQDGYYYLSAEPGKSGLIRYVDKKSWEDIILCGKPDCEHVVDAGESTCNAYVRTMHGGGGEFASLFYFEGNLYVVAEEYDPVTVEKSYWLTKISLDGMTRKKIWKLEWKDREKFPDLSAICMMHRGKFYFIAYRGSSDNPERVYAYDLRTQKCKLVAEDICGIDNTFLMGDFLYLRCWDEEKEKNYFLRHTISTGESKILQEYSIARPYENGILWCCGDNYDEWVLTDITGESEKKELPGFASVVCAGADSFCAEIQEYKHKGTGEIVNYEEYCDNPESYDYAGSRFEIVDKDTLGVLSSIEVGNSALRYIRGKTFFCLDATGGVMKRLDLSKIGTEELIWQESEKVSG